MARKNLFEDFTKIPNRLLLDNSVSDGAKIFWVYLSSKREDWKYFDKNISNELGISQETLRRRRRELAKHGYIVVRERVTSGGANAGIDYHLFASPGDRSEYVKNLEDIDTNPDLPPHRFVDSPPQKCGVQPPTDLWGLNKTNNKTNSIVATEVDDEEIVGSDSETFRQALIVAQHLANRLSDSIDTYKMPTKSTLRKWAKDIDRAIRLDGRTREQLISVIDYIHDKDTFWVANIKSGKKLREQFDTLWYRMSNDTSGTIDIKTKARHTFGLGNVFFVFKRKDGATVQVCLFGDKGYLYDYGRSEYLPHEESRKVWKYIEKNFDALRSSFEETA
jgi:DNA-binding Lrp family transcriptional regulator